MLTTLWVITIASMVALAGGLTGRNGINAARNRIQLERTFWIASGCARRAQAAVDAALAGALTLEDENLRWRTLGRALQRFRALDGSGCDLEMEAAGTRLSVNDASDDVIDRLLRALGHGEEALSLVDALADWRDTDDTRRPSGAERDWYAGAGRLPPRNAPLADIRELSSVRGFERRGTYDSVMTTDGERISLATAPMSVLLAVPGFTRETAERVVALQMSGTPLRDPLQLAGMISPTSRDELFAHYAEIVRITTVDPDAWILTSRASSGTPPSTVTLEWRMLRDQHRVIIGRTRVIE
jgi:general secretion pathway protein K